MIFYFSGTGNSLWVARHFEEAFHDRLCSIGKAIQTGQLTYTFGPDEMIGFVIPCHAWGVPPVVVQFVNGSQFAGIMGQLCYVVFTCGDSCGKADEQVRKLLKANRMECRHVYSVRMPNTYICMKNFRLDSAKAEEAKIRQAENDIPAIVAAIRNDRPARIYHAGAFKRIKTRYLHPRFVKKHLSSKPFHTTGKCNACGLCAKKCPVGNIVLINNKPGWKQNCTQCLACLHYCPNEAIEYGRHTEHKGRYRRFISLKETDPFLIRG